MVWQKVLIKKIKIHDAYKRIGRLGLEMAYISHEWQNLMRILQVTLGVNEAATPQDTNNFCVSPPVLQHFLSATALTEAQKKIKL